MGKKKRPNERDNCDDSSTGSCDEPSTGCVHIRKSADPTKIRKQIKIVGLQLENCSECQKLQPLVNLDIEKIGSEQLSYEKTLWLCLKCGTQLCKKHSESHFLVSSSLITF